MIYITERGAYIKNPRPGLGDLERGNIKNLMGERMKKTAIRCTAILSALSLMALTQPSGNSQASDSNQLDVANESKFQEKTIAKPTEIRSTTNLFENNLIEIGEITQDKNFDKNSSFLNQQIGVISDEEFFLLCQLVAAEAENQPFEGKRAVAAVVLNRVDYGWPFEDSIEEVIFQEGQFSCVSDKRFFDAWAYVSDEDQEAVAAELSERKYSEYLYFTAGHYGDYGTPAEQIGEHYFCTE